MGTTSKIVYGSALLLSLVLLFLIYSMQKSAQLTLDIQNIEHTVQKKDQEIVAMQQQLETVIVSDKKKATIIPQLTSNLETAAKEQRASLQQLDELQQQLGDAGTQLAELSRLRKENSQQQFLLAETKKERDSAKTQISSHAEKLKNAQEALLQEETRLAQLTAVLEQKDLLIKSFQEQQKQTTEQNALAKDTLAKNHLNLTLVLDDLTAKNQLIKELSLKTDRRITSSSPESDMFSPRSEEKITGQKELQTLIETLASPPPAAADSTAPALSASLARKDNELQIVHAQLQQLKSKQQVLVPALIAEAKELRLINDTLHKNLREQDSSIESLHREIIAKEALLVTGTIERDKLLLIEQNTHQELETTKDQIEDFSTLLTEKTTAFEEQLAEMEEKNKTLTAELIPAKEALSQAELESIQLNEALTTADTALEQERTAALAHASVIKPVKLALSQTEKKFSALQIKHEELTQHLAQLTEAEEDARSELNAKLSTTESVLKTAEEKANSLQNELLDVTTEMADKDGAIKRLTAQLTEHKTHIADLEVRLERANAKKTAEDNSNTESQDLRIAALIAEVTASQTLSAEHAVTLHSIETQLSLLEKEKERLSRDLQEVRQENSTLAEQSSVLHVGATEQVTLLEDKIATLNSLETQNKHLKTGLDNCQNRLARELKRIKTLETERNQLLLHTVDSDNDSVSDAQDRCPDTVPGAGVNAEGCEEDTDQDGLVNRLDLCPDTGLVSETDSAGCSAEQTTIILKNITFQLGTAELTESDQTVLDTVALILRNNPGQNMEVAGHTDSRGEIDSNLLLSTARAQAVLDYLTNSGVAADTLQVKGYGSSEPIGDNATNTGRALNRRVELRRTLATVPQAAPPAESTNSSGPDKQETESPGSSLPQTEQEEQSLPAE